MGEYYTHRLIVQYTINQKGKVFQEFRKTQNHAMQPMAHCTSFEVGQPLVRPG
jgi:hypothetical protein